jgi:hypothetical protein
MKVKADHKKSSPYAAMLASSGRCIMMQGTWNQSYTSRLELLGACPPSPVAPKCIADLYLRQWYKDSWPMCMIRFPSTLLDPAQRLGRIEDVTPTPFTPHVAREVAVVVACEQLVLKLVVDLDALRREEWHLPGLYRYTSSQNMRR